MQNHYYKLKPKHEQLNDVFGSLVYSLLPSDSLLTKPRIVDTVFNYFRDHPDESRGMTRRVGDINRTIDNLVKNNLIKEVNSVRLQRWLESF